MSKETQLATLTENYPKAPRRRTAYLKELVLPSDQHQFIGRIYDLSVVAYSFESYDDMSQYPDCLYALNVNEVLSSLTRRVESLNHVADLLWLEDKFVADPHLPVTRYEWLNICADTFLMRYVSLFDCALLLTNEVLECDLRPQVCSLKNLRRNGAAPRILDVLKEMDAVVSSLRNERNERFHRGWEREHTSDDISFKASTIHENRGMRMTGTDRYGRPLDQAKFLREGLVNLQRDFKKSSTLYIKSLDKLYDLLEIEFEGRFSPKFNDQKTGFGYQQRTRSLTRNNT
ncbi:Cthe_2314 family HEPN domain-containing protein [Microbulbifer sp. S227A]|uniref:Cthe_2314 family HEPN domain-containing protein n=1 Tax=Microbulbifer sp. S227A TaxID=3415131 RepID=UPI003C7CDF50